MPNFANLLAGNSNACLYDQKLLLKFEYALYLC